ncbi:MAG TPA: MtrB/PioB family outer membrane beta-barrel protein [Candidatus Acidoferrum sp.]|nr:MtrB/PioB family outer membrane beta-barrel protein [Candidatus Acidoferrum sp.]
MRKTAELAILAVLTCLISPYRAFGQDNKDADHGTVDFGVRFATGDVYGRPDLPFQPSLKASQFNEYQDVRDGFYVRRLDVKFNNVLHTKNYFGLQSQSTLYHDQSYLASYGQYGKFKVQFRYDEIPHIYSDTTRTLFAQTSPGVYRFPALIRQALQAATPANTIPNIVNTQVVPQSNFFTPAIYRKAGTISAGYNLNSHWTVNGMFFRESQKGARPIGLIMNSSPSASTTSGFGVELPEPINYFNNLVRLGADFGWRSLVVQGAYIGSFFQNNTSTLTWDNPFRLNPEAITNPLTGAMALYPDNHANYFSFAAGTDLGKYLHVTASITPGWLKQTQAFLPYTTNTTINTCGNGTQACNSLAVLPAPNLGGDAQTLAMNYTISTASWKNITLKANYRQYDYNDNTPSRAFTPVQGDAAAPGAAVDNLPFGFNRKDLEVSGIWFFAKKSSIKAGVDELWMDRTDRDVSHSLDNTFFVAGDWVPIRDLLIRLSYRHSNRTPDAYQDEQVTDTVTGLPVVCNDNTDVTFTGDQRCHRRFDEAARTLNRGDFLVQYSPWDKLTVSAFGGTLQNDYNKRGSLNSLTPLNFLTGAAATVSPYYLYGLQKDISYNYGFDADYAFSSHVTLYAEYSREHYYQRMITRYRTPPAAGLNITTCTGCDTANNDWQSTATDPVDVYSVGVDLYLSKKAYFTTYYTLSAGKGNVNSEFLGDPTITTGANAFLLTGTNAATPYPETVERNHEIGVIFKYKLTDRLTPRIEYRYQQWDNRDYQTTVMTPYMGCVSPAPPGAAVPNCGSPILNSATSPTPLPGAASPFYPGFVVGDPSSARYLFLGVDQPSYHAHTVMATLEYRF